MLDGDKRARTIANPIETPATKRQLKPEKPEEIFFIAFSFSSLKVIALGELCNNANPIDHVFPQIRLLAGSRIRSGTDAQENSRAYSAGPLPSNIGLVKS